MNYALTYGKNQETWQWQQRINIKRKIFVKLEKNHLFSLISLDHPANLYRAYHSARIYNGNHMPGVKKDDDSSSELYSPIAYHAKGHNRDLLNTNAGILKGSARDDSMPYEQLSPVNEGYKIKASHHGEVRSVDSIANDDSSLEGFEMRFPSHKDGITSHHNGNDDSFSEYLPRERPRNKGHKITDGVLWAEKRGGSENLDDDSAASEEEKIAKYSGRGTSLYSQRIDDDVDQDTFHKQGKTRNCLICCIYPAR